MKSCLTQFQPIAWLVAALLAFPFVDCLIDGLYVAHTTNEAVVRGRGTRSELEAHPEVEVLVIGDSSSRHGVNARVLSERLGLSSWNIGTWHGAFAGQATLVHGELESGRRLRAIVLVTTENGMALPMGAEAEEVVMLHYLSWHALSLWWGLDRLSVTRSLEWSWALISPSYRDGKGLESFALSLWDHSPAHTWSLLAHQRAVNAAQARAYIEDRGHGPLSGWPKGPGALQFDTFRRVILESDYRWSVHPEVQFWYGVLLASTDAHEVPLFHFFTPRMRDLLKHPRWKERVGDPTRAWAAEMRRKHPTFHLAMDDPFPMGAEEFNDTSDHLNAAAALRFSHEVSDIVGRSIDVGG